MLSALVFQGIHGAPGMMSGNQNPILGPHTPQQGTGSCTQVAPSWSLLQCTVTFPPRASPACSVRLWLAPTPHSAVGPGDLPVPGAVVVTPGRAEGLAVLASLRVAVSETASHLPASQLFCQQIEGCRLRLSVALAALPLWIPPCPAHPRLRCCSHPGQY